MRIRHLNGATLRPASGRLPGLPPRQRPALVTHCLLIELDSGLALVDTGIGLLDIAVPLRRLGPEFLAWTNPLLDASETLARQVDRLGFERQDVRDIVLSHLDPEHAGGLSDFPEARVHLMAREYSAATSRFGALMRRRYRPQQWAHGPRWELYEPDGPRWFDFEAAPRLRGLTERLRLVWLPGHSQGHAGVAIHDSGRWLLFTGDATLPAGEIGDNGFVRACTGPLRSWGFPVGDTHLTESRLAALRQAREQNVLLVSSHDPADFELFGRLRARP